MGKIRSKTVIIHCIATILTFVAFQILSVALNLEYVPFANQKRIQVDLNFALQKKLYVLDMYNYGFHIGVALILAIVVSLIQSILVCRKNKWHWINSLFAIIVAILIHFVIGRFSNLGQAVYYFHINASYLDIILKGFTVLAISLVLFHLKKVKTFIARD